MGDGRWIMNPKSFDQSFDGNSSFLLCLVYGNLFPNQLADLGDGRERIRDRLNADLIYRTVIPGAHTGHKFYEDDGLFTWLEILQVRICSALGAVITPSTPILLPSFSILRSDSLSNCSPRKQYIT